MPEVWELPADDQSAQPAPPEELAATIQQILGGVFGNVEEGKMGDWDFTEVEEEDRDLTTEEMFIVALFIKGFGMADMAKATGHSEAYCSNVILLPAAQQMLKRVDIALENEIKGMKGIAIGAMRQVLQSGDPKAQTAMVEKYFKISGRFDGDNNKPKTAEDVIAKMLDIIKQQADTTNHLTHAKNAGIDGEIRREPPPAGMMLDYDREKVIDVPAEQLNDEE